MKAVRLIIFDDEMFGNGKAHAPTLKTVDPSVTTPPHGCRISSLSFLLDLIVKRIVRLKLKFYSMSKEALVMSFHRGNELPPITTQHHPMIAKCKKTKKTEEKKTHSRHHPSIRNTQQSNLT